MRHRILNLIFLFFLSASLTAQTGGDNSYEFLNLTHSSLVSSLGGANVSLRVSDPSLAYHNPSLLDSTAHGSLALNYVNYFAGINYGYAMYSASINSRTTYAAGLTYLNYGSFIAADPSGNITGTFRASEYAFTFICSFNIDSSFSIGVDLKPVLSHLEDYTSFGVALDIGGSWHSRNELTSAGVVIRNSGLQLTSYAGEAKEKLPFEVMAGVTHKLAHAPLRLSLTLRHLEKYDITNYPQQINPVTGLPEENENSLPFFAENLLRHTVLGVELTPAKNFYLSAGYNYQRRSELQVESKISAVGFSWGFGIRTSYLTIGFGRAMYHLAGSSNHFSIVIKPQHLYNRMRN